MSQQSASGAKDSGSSFASSEMIAAPVPSAFEAWLRGLRPSGGRDHAEAHARGALPGSLGTMRGWSFARGARTPWKRVSG